MNRRDFIKGCTAGLAMFATARLRTMASPFLPGDDNHIFVLIFLRGGCDGLNLIGPSSSSVYNDSRPGFLRVEESGKKAGYLLDNPLGGVGFRLHHDAPELRELYEQGDLAVLQACGLKNGTRSHFVAMDLIERGLLKKSGRAQGWMSRYFDQVAAGGNLPAVSATSALPESFRGFQRAVSMTQPSEFDLLEYVRYPELLRNWYGSSDLLGRTAQTTLDTIELVKSGLDGDYRPEGGAEYPEWGQGGELGKSLKTLAQLIKMDQGVRIGQVDYGGWDTHEHQQFVFSGLVKGLSKSLAAFYKDLHNYHDRLTILVKSEFGRRLRANRSEGTDHGYGNMMMVLGGKVNGGRMYGKWPGLETRDLDKGVDLAITTDYRDVLSEILQQRMGLTNPGKVFPGFTPGGRLGFLG